ncbi:MAG: thioredoxin family protein [Planctomycetota bacterium]
MALTPSKMNRLGTEAPDFRLWDVVSGQEVSRDDLMGGKGLLLMFLCCHCPYVVHVREEVARLGNEYGRKGIGIAAISSNDAESYPEDAPEKLKEMAESLSFRFPYCYDATQDVARAYHAACTPDFFLYNARNKLVYRGQLDDSRPGNNIPVDGADLRAALDALIEGQEIMQNQKPSLGCNIKWKTK